MKNCVDLHPIPVFSYNMAILNGNSISSTGIAGVAYVRATCNLNWAHGVSEDKGRYATTSFAAHELGHK